MRSLPGQLGDIQGSRAEPPSTVTRLSSLSSTRTTRGSLLSCGPLAEQVEVFGGCKVCEGIAESLSPRAPCRASLAKQQGTLEQIGLKNAGPVVCLTPSAGNPREPGTSSRAAGTLLPLI